MADPSIITEEDFPIIHVKAKKLHVSVIHGGLNGQVAQSKRRAKLVSIRAEMMKTTQQIKSLNAILHDLYLDEYVYDQQIKIDEERKAFNLTVEEEITKSKLNQAMEAAKIKNLKEAKRALQAEPEFPTIEAMQKKFGPPGGVQLEGDQQQLEGDQSQDNEQAKGVQHSSASAQPPPANHPAATPPVINTPADRPDPKPPVNADKLISAVNSAIRTPPPVNSEPEETWQDYNPEDYEVVENASKKRKPASKPASEPASKPAINPASKKKKNNQQADGRGFFDAWIANSEKGTVSSTDHDEVMSIANNAPGSKQ